MHVIAIDRRRTPSQGLAELVTFGCFALWAWEAVAFGWPVQRHLVPGALGIVVLHSPALRGLGALAIVAALPIWLAAMGAMDDAWRIGIDRDTPGALVTGGIFAWTRNPIYVAFDLLVVGTFLQQGRLIFLVLGAVLLPMLHFQILREERFLERQYGSAYRAYCARVGRYV